ncbi:Aspartic proteinase nepenthesin-1 [Dichanthelium oligosanthes]|uniref:Aspartic proteinase nepenthesin-1 n=1 Tax=Dichanthelium oligosanthes TaxID=888268 RepID=A0A1E5UT53_9POAL|nr:Aspartic proteinase nepenthesin-1 [Dichanthelium oligosanthes]
MAMACHLHRLLLLFLVVVAMTAAPALAIFHFDFRFDTDGPFSRGMMSRHDMWRRAALESKARLAKNTAKLAKAVGKGGDITASDVTVSPYTHQGHWLTVGVGTPPQPSKVVLDMGSDLLWTQCSLMGPTAIQEEPVYDPSRSSSFSLLPCSSKECEEGAFTSKNCTDKRCAYENYYGVLTATGVLATENFTFGTQHNVSVPLAFGCGKLTNGTIAGASGILGLSPGPSSLLKQLAIQKFSYCLTPFTDRKTSPVMFGAMADLGKYKTTGKIQTIPLLKNAIEDIYYYVPMVGISLGSKRLDVPADSLALKPDGTGGTAVDSATTLAYLVEPAFKELKKAVMEGIKLSVANKTVDDYPLCFVLPRGMSMDGVQTPPLVLHFEGDAEMVLPRDNYFQEPKPGMMCLAVVQSPFEGAPSVIGNVQQQNMHVLYDVGDRKFSYAPTQCDKL